MLSRVPALSSESREADPLSVTPQGGPCCPQRVGTATAGRLCGLIFGPSATRSPSSSGEADPPKEDGASHPRLQLITDPQSLGNQGLGLGSGVGRPLGVGIVRGVGVGRGVGVAEGVGVGVGVTVGVAVGVTVGVGVGVGPPDGKTRT